MRLGPYDLPGVFVGDCRDMMRALPDGCVHMLATSPPYWGLRNYGLPPSTWGGDPSCAHEWGVADLPGTDDVDPKDLTAGAGAGRTCTKCQAWLGCFGLEPTPDAYVDHMVEIFAEARRVLRDDGTLWLNLGDSYATKPYADSHSFDPKYGGRNRAAGYPNRQPVPGVKPKDLVGIPWMAAFALREAGWYLRCDCVWAKGTSGQKELIGQVAAAAAAVGVDPETAARMIEMLDPFVGNPMPESVDSRPSKSHEYVFLLAKNYDYFYDADAVREENSPASFARVGRPWRAAGHKWEEGDGPGAQTLKGADMSKALHAAGRNRRSVWAIVTHPYHGAHFATWPPELVEPMIRAGTSERGACAACGAPWRRVTESEKLAPDAVVSANRKDLPNDTYSRHKISIPGGQSLAGQIRRSVGWEPACECGPGAGTAPCVVLDPFFGSGTTGQVAEALGRLWLGFDLNPAYAKLAQERNAQASLLSLVHGGAA